MLIKLIPILIIIIGLIGCYNRTLSTGRYKPEDMTYTVTITHDGKLIDQFVKTVKVSEMDTFIAELLEQYAEQFDNILSTVLYDYDAHTRRGIVYGKKGDKETEVVVDMEY